jgi:hypothetical protein
MSSTRVNSGDVGDVGGLIVADVSSRAAGADASTGRDLVLRTRAPGPETTPLSELDEPVVDRVSDQIGRGREPATGSTGGRDDRLGRWGRHDRRRRAGRPVEGARGRRGAPGCAVGMRCVGRTVGVSIMGANLCLAQTDAIGAAPCICMVAVHTPSSVVGAAARHRIPARITRDRHDVVAPRRP